LQINLKKILSGENTKLILNLLNNPQYLRLHTALCPHPPKKKLSVVLSLIVEKKYLHIINTHSTQSSLQHNNSFFPISCSKSHNEVRWLWGFEFHCHLKHAG